MPLQVMGGVPMFLSSYWSDTLEADERGVAGPLFEGVEGPSSGAADAYPFEHRVVLGVLGIADDSKKLGLAPIPFS